MTEQHNKVKAVITYKSGREETLTASLLKGGNWPKTFTQKVNDLKNFPTVTDVKVTTF